MEEIIANSIENIPTINANAVFTSKNKIVFREDDEIAPKPIGDKYRYIPWGADDLLPYNVIDLIEADETMSTCQLFNAEICYGAGMKLNTDNAKSNIKNTVADFFEDNDLPSYFLSMCRDMKHFEFTVSVLFVNDKRNAIERIIRKEACYCRFEEADKNGCIRHIFYADWRNNPDIDEIEIIELLDFNNPLKDLLVRLGKEKGPEGQKKMRTTKRKFAVVSKMPHADSTYYPIPYYGALFRSGWYNIKKLIAIAKESKLKNNAPIKYHIEVDSKYWERLCHAKGVTDKKEQLKTIAEEKQKILDFLTGIENSGKVWFSSKYQTPDGKVVNDVTINKIDSDTKEGGDWSTDIQEAVNMICFTMRVHSNLVGSVPGKSQTNNSGSDKRELYNISQAMQKPYHDMIFKAMKTVIRFNEWKDVYPEVPFIQMTTLDKNTETEIRTL